MQKECINQYKIKTRLWLKVKVKSLSHVRLFVTPWTVAYQAPPSMGFSRLRVLEWIDQGIFPTQESNPGLPSLQADTLLSEPPGKYIPVAERIPLIFIS